MREATCWPASQVYYCCDIFLSITLTCALPTHQKRKEAKKVGSLVVIKQSAQNNLQTILPCGLKSFGSSLLMSNSYVWLLTESSSETLIQRNARELALVHLTWQGNVSSLNSWQFGLVIVINPPSLVGEELITLSGWGNWKTSCVKIVFAWINGEDDMISVCLSVFSFSGEISQNIGPQKYKGSLYSVSWGGRFLPWELQGPWSTPLAMHSSSVTCPCNSPGRMPSPVADIFFVYLQGISLDENCDT